MFVKALPLDWEHLLRDDIVPFTASTKSVESSAKTDPFMSRFVFIVFSSVKFLLGLIKDNS